jgi:hypothetical protein
MSLGGEHLRRGPAVHRPAEHTGKDQIRTTEQFLVKWRSPPSKRR